MLAAVNTLNDIPLAIWVFGGVVVLLFLWHFAVDVKRPTRLIVSVAILCSGALTIGIHEFLTPRKSLATHGGTVFTLRIQARQADDGSKLPLTEAQLKQVLAVIEKRLHAMGLAEAKLTLQGEDGILLEVPGLQAAGTTRLRNSLGTVGKLELREVNPRSEEPGPDGKTLAARVAAGSEIVPGFSVFTYQRKDMDGNALATPILISRRPALSAKDIALATPSPQQSDAVAITLDNNGTNKMIALTQNMTPRRDRIAIVLDDVVVSAPVVNSVPLGKNFIVEGLREPGAVDSLANALMSPLENALVIEDERTIPPPTASK
ncbi:MAG: hypothetical protein NTW21_22025 [Verrucomicrobia bacterium]|nr:hypothetical protein [Verrucomicrobiota bacterium]